MNLRVFFFNAQVFCTPLDQWGIPILSWSSCTIFFSFFIMLSSTSMSVIFPDLRNLCATKQNKWNLCATNLKPTSTILHTINMQTYFVTLTKENTFWKTLRKMKFLFQVCFFTCFFTYTTTGIEYDYLVVAFQWQYATCREPFTQCRQIPRNSFSLHGVWPTKYRGPSWQSGPFFCSGGKVFDRSVVSFIEFYSPIKSYKCSDHRYI